MPEPLIVSATELTDLQFDSEGRPRTPLVFIDLDAAKPDLALIAARSTVVTVGFTSRPVQNPVLRDALTFTLTTARASAPAEIHVDDLDAARTEIGVAVAHAPHAAMTLNTVLRLTERLPVDFGLAAESSAYSMLLAGREFTAWRKSRPVRFDPGPVGDPILIERHADVLVVIMNRAERHNAFGRDLRDGLIEAFELVLADTTLGEVQLRGNGQSFCSGGDLDEFGASSDVSTAHLVRLDRSVASRLHRCRERTTAYLHGACIGAGIEIPSFAARVVAASDTIIRLPEISMGLIPGAGGTVGITARIGRWRTAWLAITGSSLSAADALEWGLVDALGE